MKDSMKIAFEDSHLKLDIDLSRFGFISVRNVAVGIPDECCTGEWPALRLHVDIDGSCAETEPTQAQEGSPDAQR